MKALLVLVPSLISLGSTAQSWTQIGADIDGDTIGAISGSAVSMPDPYTVAIGAPIHDGPSDWAGQVRVFSWSGNAWVQQGAAIYGEGDGDQSGRALSMPDANTVAIGSEWNDDNGTYAGHVRVYTWSGTAWEQQGADIDGEAADDRSGTSVCMPDANTVAIGAPLNAGDLGAGTGQVRVYSWNGSAWIQKGVDIDGEAAADRSGTSVSMPDANTVAIGATENENVNGFKAGHVRVYAWSGSAWEQKGTDIDGEAPYDGSGASVSMPDANTVAIGAPENDGNGTQAGQVRVYTWSGSSWEQRGGDIDGEAQNDHAGTSVDMPDANTVAIGADGNDDNGFASGHARIYSWSGSEWVQIGADIDGEAQTDFSGMVSMPDAGTVAVGAPQNDGGASNAGHVRVYGLLGVGIRENTVRELHAYPNPTTGQLTIDLDQVHATSTISIVNAMGQHISAAQVNTTGLFTLKLEGPAGVYFVTVSDGGNVPARVKVLKQ